MDGARRDPGGGLRAAAGRRGDTVEGSHVPGPEASAGLREPSMLRQARPHQPTAALFQGRWDSSGPGSTSSKVKASPPRSSTPPPRLDRKNSLHCPGVTKQWMASSTKPSSWATASRTVGPAAKQEPVGAQRGGSHRIIHSRLNAPSGTSVEGSR